MSSKLINELRESKEYRDAYVAAHVRNGIAFQLRTMRCGRGWDQKELAARLGNVKLQPVVSRYENPDYGRFSVSTLLDLAKAFDVALVVKFAPFNEVVGWEARLSEGQLNVSSFEDETGPFPATGNTNSFYVFAQSATCSSVYDSLPASPRFSYLAAATPIQTEPIAPTKLDYPRVSAMSSIGGIELWKQPAA